MKLVEDFYPQASSNFLTKELTYDEIQELEDITQYAREPFQYWEEDALAAQISNLASQFYDAYIEGVNQE